MALETEKVTLFATANVGMASLANWITNFGTTLGILVPLGQFAVSVITIIFIWKKIATKTQSRRRPRK